jgi:predicted enzyme related to lactoylglutathione lyase
MRITRQIILAVSLAGAASILMGGSCNLADAATWAVGPQYDTTHVYVAAADFNRFVTSFTATFGGTTSKQGVFQVTPTPSQTMSQLALTPAGTISVFGFKTPIPAPFGSERTGYLVTNLDAATKAAQSAGASVIVAPFPDPIGRDAVIQWPGGVNMQLYWHTTPPNYTPLGAIPENRIYIAPDRADAFIHDFLAFATGHIVSDDKAAPGAEIGKPTETFRRVRLETAFGKLMLLATDGHLPFPYGRELTGYAVPDLDGTIAKAKAAGVDILVQPQVVGGRRTAMVQFPGGYIAEIHAVQK